MKTFLFIALPLMAIRMASGAAIPFIATGIYDETGNANAVDAVAGLGNVTTTPAAATALNNYKALFLSAYNSNKGGVINFDSAAGDSSTYDQMTVTYGAGNLNSLTINQNGGGAYYFENNAVFGGAGGGISGSRYLRSGSQAVHGFSFATPLSDVGFTVIDRTAGNGDRAVTATATYLFGGSQVITATITAGGDDTFFGFTAPAGNPITSLVLSAGTENYFAIDDLAFVVSDIPEPSAVSLGALAAAGFLVRRRRA